MHIKKNGRKLVAIALMLVACLGISSVFAYLMDTDAEKNEFTVGHVSLDLQEPGWDPEKGTELVPGDEVDKDPRIYNDGVSNEYVFMTVAVPYQNIEIADSEGNVTESADTQLFTYTVNPGWEQLGNGEWKDGYVTYVYAYATDGKMTVLSANASTTALFDRVAFVGAVEDNGLETTVRDIIVNAYGIQTAGFDNEKYSPDDLWGRVMSSIPSIGG